MYWWGGEAQRRSLSTASLGEMGSSYQLLGDLNIGDVLLLLQYVEKAPNRRFGASNQRVELLVLSLCDVAAPWKGGDNGSVVIPQPGCWTSAHVPSNSLHHRKRFGGDEIAPHLFNLPLVNRLTSHVTSCTCWGYCSSNAFLFTKMRVTKKKHFGDWSDIHSSCS